MNGQCIVVDDWKTNQLPERNMVAASDSFCPGMRQFNETHPYNLAGKRFAAGVGG